jgi:hypothetical protein
VILLADKKKTITEVAYPNWKNYNIKRSLMDHQKRKRKEYQVQILPIIRMMALEAPKSRSFLRLKKTNSKWNT